MSLPTPYYDRDGITLYHGDSREILPMLDDASVDMVFTDPPYGHNNNNGDLISRWEEALGKGDYVAERDNRPIANDGPEANELVQWMFGEARRLLVPGGCCCCCCGGGGPDPQFARWSLWMDAAIGFKQMVVWDKGGLGMGWHYRRNYEVVLVGEKPGAACKWYGGNNTPNIIRENGIKPKSWEHPTPKPLNLVSTFLQLHSEPGDLILEPFSGGGTTLLAARNMGRRAIGIEIEEKYCKMAVERLAQGVLFT